ncbi:MAG: phospholipase D family protein [Chloroflexi bacterium]|nr:phospholipase D family protein [Chloroflexota bacterium]
MESYEVVQSPIEARLASVFQEAKQTLFIAAPYIKTYGTEVVLRNTSARQLKVLTNLDLTNITSSGFDLEALLSLWTRFDVSVSSLGKLHAKVYVADRQVAFLTSANLTRGGLKENHEYGIILRDTRLISLILKDMEGYFGLGNIFDREQLTALTDDVAQIKQLQHSVESSAEFRELNRLLRQKGQTLQRKVLENRVSKRTINTIFAETIQYLLETRGPLSTSDLHPLIQDIHPDICDDTIDRVIHGQHFGKKWKHAVRNAQQSLKQNGVIELKEQRWHLA